MNKQEVLEYLTQRGIAYRLYEHPAVFTIEELDRVGLPDTQLIAKNLFLRDDKGKNHYLVTLAGHKPVDLHVLAQRIPSRKLSFGSPERLMAHLGLTPGSVTPLGLLNNAERDVTMVFDRALEGTVIGVHPMENTATIFLSFDELAALLREHGSPVVLCDMD